MKTTQSLLFQCLTFLTVKAFPLFGWNLSHFNLYLLYLLLPLCATGKNLVPYSWQPPCRYHKAAVRSPQSCPCLQAEEAQLPQALLTSGPWPDLLGCPPLEQLQLIDILLVLGDPKLDAAFQMGSINCWVVDINNPFPRSPGCAPVKAAWDAVGHLCFQGTLPAHA